jgi:diguanylate cyclase (GGDEF)-like protein
MGVGARLMLRRFFDTGEAKTAFGRALLRERYRALQRQIPLLYTIGLTNFLGLVVAGGGDLRSFYHPASLLIPFVVVRLIHWVRRRGKEPAPERILVELRKTLVLAALLSLGFGYATVVLFAQTAGREQDIVVLFASLASLGCAYGLTSFPAAARMPLLLFTLPLAAVLATTGQLAHAGIGISLALIVMLTLRLVDIHNDSFVQLVWSRSEVESERERAQRAEQVALAEKARVRQVADSDPLTGLANRRAFVAALTRRLATADIPVFALALLDLDGFKPVNDTFGHAAGDALLIEVSARLRQEAGPGALVARIGGDEFALILPCANDAALARSGAQICAALGRPYLIGGREFRISACCGLTIAEPGRVDVATALSRGDAALYHGKQKGRGCVSLFTPAIAEANQRRIAIERALREPAVTRQISLAFQPIYDLSTGVLRSFEALARWTHPTLGTVTPAEFIPITEQINVIEAISEDLLRDAAREAATWPDSVRLSFNLSAVQLCSARSAGRLLDIAAAAGVEPARLQFEVTETALLVDFGLARLNLERLRAAGARIVLDDFGAGFASISYLREMIFDAIKLDGSLVAGAAESPAGVRLLTGVIELCASLQVPCVAEHIETQGQLDLLRHLRCRDGQGFALSRPVGAAEARAIAASQFLPLGLRKQPKAHRAA